MVQVPSLGHAGRRRIGRSSRVWQIHAYDLRTKEDVLFFDESEISVYDGNFAKKTENQNNFISL